MANNIYVGNRYVPLPLGYWNINTSYEPFSAVIYSDGNGYISRKFSPAGTLPTDTDYWVFWGSSNAVTDALSSRMTAIENRTDNLEPRVDSIEQDITNIQAELLAHDSRLNFLTNVTTSLATTTENLINTQGKLVAVSTYGKTTGQELSLNAVMAVIWERTRSQNIFETSISITNSNGSFTFNIPDPTKKYYLSVSSTITWSKPGGISDNRALILRNGTTNVISIPCIADVRTISLPEFYYGEINSSTALSINFSGFPSDAISFSDPGDANFVTFKIWENPVQ